MLKDVLVYSLTSQFAVRNAVPGGIVGCVTAVKFSLLLLSIAVPAVCLVVLQRGAIARPASPTQASVTAPGKYLDGQR